MAANPSPALVVEMKDLLMQRDGPWTRGGKEDDADYCITLSSRNTYPEEERYAAIRGACSQLGIKMTLIEPGVHTEVGQPQLILKLEPELYSLHILQKRIDICYKLVKEALLHEDMFFGVPSSKWKMSGGGSYSITILPSVAGSWAQWTGSGDLAEALERFMKTEAKIPYTVADVRDNDGKSHGFHVRVSAMAYDRIKSMTLRESEIGKGARGR